MFDRFLSQSSISVPPKDTIVIFISLTSNILNLRYNVSAQKICDVIVKTFDQHWSTKSHLNHICNNKNANVEVFLSPLRKGVYKDQNSLVY